VVFGVKEEGYREILEAVESTKKDSSRGSFIALLKDRGLQGVQLFSSDKFIGMVKSFGT
jgi:transposase-like protein